LLEKTLLVLDFVGELCANSVVGFIKVEAVKDAKFYATVEEASFVLAEEMLAGL